jgi:hypothetical protein
VSNGRKSAHQRSNETHENGGGNDAGVQPVSIMWKMKIGLIEPHHSPTEIRAASRTNGCSHERYDENEDEIMPPHF